MEFFELEIAGLKRKLPIVYLGPKLRIASLSLLGDVELVEKTAQDLVDILKRKKIVFDYFVGPEVKVVPLMYEMSKIARLKHYIVCRKAIKGYMVSPLILHPDNPLKRFKTLVIDGQDGNLVKGKRVVIVDDVVTTGTTINAVRELMTKAQAQVVGVCSILKQGNVDVADLDYLGKLPVFKE
jgi:adenine phosphoribosyltransferase